MHMKTFNGFLSARLLNIFSCQLTTFESHYKSQTRCRPIIEFQKYSCWQAQVTQKANITGFNKRWVKPLNNSLFLVRHNWCPCVCTIYIFYSSQLRFIKCKDHMPSTYLRGIIHNHTRLIKMSRYSYVISFLLFCHLTDF